MQITIMENVLQKCNRQMISENREVILFLNNATVHQETLGGKYSNIRVVYYYNIIIKGRLLLLLLLLLLHDCSL